jgi:hypothetical protein
LRALHSSTNVCQQQLEAWSGFDVGIEQVWLFRDDEHD